MYSLIGRIVEIGEIKTYGKSNFKVQKIIVDIGTDNDVNPIPIDCRDADIDVIEKCKVNDMVSVMFNLSGRKWEGKYYVNIVSQTLNKVAEGKDDDVPVKEIDDDDIAGVRIPAHDPSPDIDDLPFILFIPLLLTSLIQYFI